MVLAAVGGFVAGRKTASPPAPARTTGASPAPSTTTTAPAGGPAVVPVTAAAARTAATRFFRLYAAGRFAAAYPLLAPAARRQITEATWVAVRQRCRGTAAGLAYQVGQATLTGRSARLSVVLPGVAPTPGPGEVTFVYRTGQWLYAPSGLAAYRGTPDQIVARLRAAGTCS